MGRDSISCIIPVYNEVQYLASTISSVVAQALPPLEVIVVDDGSRNDARSSVLPFGNSVFYIRQEHAGVSAARNKGVRASRGDLICFLDADDLLHEDKLRLQVDILRKRPEIDLCDCQSRYFWSEELVESGQPSSDPRYEHEFWQRITHGHISTWLVRREVFDRVGGFDDNLQFSEDTDWYLRFRDAGGKMATLPQILTYRRLHHRNVTAGSREDQSRDLARVLKASRDRRRSSMGR